MDVRKECSGWRAWRGALSALLVLTALTIARAEAEQTSRVDLNSASAEELASLPGVGPTKAQAIIAYRETAPFKSPEELIEVKGIGEKLFAQLKDRVTVTGAAGAAPRGGAGAKLGGSAPDGKSGRTAAAGTR